MTVRIANIALSSVDPPTIAPFWAAVLGWDVIDEEDEIISLAAPGTLMPCLDILRVPEAKSSKNRLHLDLRADGSTTAEELERLLALGARRVEVGQEEDVTWVVLADPEGNEFCLLSQTVQEVEAEGYE